MFLIKIQDSLPIKLAIAYIEGVCVKIDKDVFEKLKNCAFEYKTKYSNCPIGKIENVKYARKLFHSIGLDPTKYRPSSEALLNRALKGKEFYMINNLVDIGNWCSLEFLLPICVYDLDKIVGDTLDLRLGRKDEKYMAINDRVVNLEGKIVLSDKVGPFGSPITDSKRTAVSLNTKNAFLGIYAPKDYESRELEKNIFLFAKRVQDFCGGTLKDIKVIEG